MRVAGLDVTALELGPEEFRLNFRKRHGSILTLNLI
jgi:hypothetical protein